MLDRCPLCGGKVVMTVPNDWKTQKCEEGHVWHHCSVHPEQVIFGEPSLIGPPFTCTCPTGLVKESFEALMIHWQMYRRLKGLEE